MINYLDNISDIESEELKAYRDLINDEYQTISGNMEAFIRYPHVSNNTKIIKIYEIIDLFSLEDPEDPNIKKMEFLADLISIKELVEREI